VLNKIVPMEQINSEINSTTEFGGFWIRVEAFFVDLVVLTIIKLLVLSPFLAGSLGGSVVAKIAMGVVVPISSLVIPWIYFAVLHSSVWQASVGKMAVGLKVVDKRGHQISFGRATGRYFAKILSALPVGLGIIWIAADDRKQGWHDKIAGTVVVRKVSQRANSDKSNSNLIIGFIKRPLFTYLAPVFLFTLAMYFKGIMEVWQTGMCPEHAPGIPSQACTPMEYALFHFFTPFGIVGLFVLTVNWIIGISPAYWGVRYAVSSRLADSIFLRVSFSIGGIVLSAFLVRFLFRDLF